MRTLAKRAGISVGSISYQIGDRAALLKALAERELELAQTRANSWIDHISPVPARALDCLADIVNAWLDYGAPGTNSDNERTGAIVQCALQNRAHRDPAGVNAIIEMYAIHRSMWEAICSAQPDASCLAARIAAYCIDERPFSLLLGGVTTYRLLRQSTVRALLCNPRDPVPSHASAWHMGLVDSLGEAAREASALPEPMQNSKAAMVEGIAALMLDQGLEGLSHRAVARRVDAPVSSVSHHFPTQRDLLLTGVEALYRQMRADLNNSQDQGRSGHTVILLSHEIALAALQEDYLRAFAIDMRRRRAENVLAPISLALTGKAECDRATSQAFIMALIGQSLATPTLSVETRKGWRATLATLSDFTQIDTGQVF